MNVQNVTIGKFMLGVLNYKNKETTKKRKYATSEEFPIWNNLIHTKYNNRHCDNSEG